MKHMDVEGALKRAKSVLGIETDQDLAYALGVPRPTIASWRRRGSIPVKYIAMLAGGETSIDWILTGKGDQSAVDDIGISKRSSDLDNECLWISICLAARWLTELDNPQLTIDLTSKHDLTSLHAYVKSQYDKIVASKKAWERAKITSEKDIYKALLIEYHLDDSDIADPPWWEDSSII
ncbi:helix-turn-helix domain-containing protein [Inquilinus sp. OTU3971]|uniref:helix-turn-helix domain-containing protein n=1 Tax=Inquilinus sp. OTU3971 TaxID=3043855 RepID=UPI00313EDFE6